MAPFWCLRCVIYPAGRTLDQNPENYTHAVYMRFQKKDDLVKFYENPMYLRVLKEHVTPHCQVCTAM